MNIAAVLLILTRSLATTVIQEIYCFQLTQPKSNRTPADDVFVKVYSTHATAAARIEKFMAKFLRELGFLFDDVLRF